jgi:hypothetical protein
MTKKQARLQGAKTGPKKKTTAPKGSGYFYSA